MLVKETTTTETVRQHSTKLTGDVIKALLGLPESANVTFDIPIGGDYSGMTLDVDNETPVSVTWSTKE